MLINYKFYYEVENQNIIKEVSFETNQVTFEDNLSSSGYKYLEIRNNIPLSFDLLQLLQDSSIEGLKKIDICYNDTIVKSYDCLKEYFYKTYVDIDDGDIKEYIHCSV